MNRLGSISVQANLISKVKRQLQCTTTLRSLRTTNARRLDVYMKLDPSSPSKSFELQNDDKGSLLSYIMRMGALTPPTTTDRVALLNWMIISNTFDNFLNKKFPEEILTNCETLVPAIKTLILQANRLGVSMFVIGPMAQCGSLHVLGSCFHIPIQPMLVTKLKLAKGHSIVDTTETTCRAVSLPRSDSDTHPMMLGKTKAEQLNNSDYLGRQVWTVFLYSDCQSQGIRTSYETLQLSKHSHFSTKGIIHIILSDKDRRESKRSKHLDLASINNSPIIRVNALESEAVAYCMRLAAIHRNTFQTDVFVELEHPKLCDSIQMAVADTLNNLELKKPVMKDLSESLIKEKLITKEEVDRTIIKYEEWYEEQYIAALESVSGFSSWITNKFRFPFKKSSVVTENEEVTGIEEVKFDWILKKLAEHTRSVNIARDIAKELSARLNMAQLGEITQITAELIAFAHLLHSGVDIRISGKSQSNSDDKQRSYYNLYDIQNFNVQTPLDEMFSARFQCVETLFSRPSVLGYELGVSQRTDKSLTIWISDGPSLSNVQNVLDEFVSKTGQWFEKSNLLILVPQKSNKFEEGSISPKRCERVLDLCWELKTGNSVESNLNVVNVTSPANYFHLLMKQVNSTVPTIAFLVSDLDNITSPKEEFIGETRFESYMVDDERESGEEVVKVLLCSGSLYHSVIQARDRRGLSRLVAVPRLEQLVPFPGQALAKNIASYRHASVHYLQEEHSEKGWWTYLGPRLQKALKNIKFNINFIGPPASIRSPKQLHDYRTNIINRALDIY